MNKMEQRMKTQIQSQAVNSVVAVNFTATNAWNDSRATTIADFNGDGYRDIMLHPSLFTSGSNMAPIVLINDHNGGFTDQTAAVFRNFSPTIFQSNGVFVNQFTSDGRLGMFVVDQGLEIGDSYIGGFPGAINRFYLQDANGNWLDLTANLPRNTLSFNHLSSVVDINNDGNLDMLVTRLGGPNFEGSGTFFYKGDGKGGFTFSTAGLPEEIKYLTKTEHQWQNKSINYQFAGSVGAGDLNNDGRQDLISGSYTGGDAVTGVQSVRVLQQNAAGEFIQVWQTTQPTALKAAEGVLGVAGVVIGDLNSDGLQDAVVRWENSGKSAVQILKNLGNMQFSDVTTDWLGSYLERNGTRDASGNYPQLAQQVEIRDVNHDGNLDLVLDTVNSVATQVVDGMTTGAFLYLNDGTGHMTAWNPVINNTEVTAAQLAQMTGAPDRSQGMPLTFDTNNDGVSDYVFVNTNNASNIRLTTVFGENAGGVYRANALGETLVGSSGNDTFRTDNGPQTIDGGAGIDTLVVNAASNSVTIARHGDSVQVGQDTLANIERVQFADKMIALDINGTGGQTYRLYQAAFNRAPDLGGLGFQMNAMDHGLSLSQLAQNFINSPEFVQTYGALNDTQFVTLLYANVLHRAPDLGGLNFHVDNLAHGLTRAQTLVGFSESIENQAALIGVLQNGFEYVPFVG
jgi:hypothetical protein